MWATRPHLGSIFEKLLHRKTFQFACGSSFEAMLSEKTIAAGKLNCEMQFASQMWAARPHLGSIFEKLLHRKTFYSPAARFLQPIMFHLVFDSLAS